MPNNILKKFSTNYQEILVKSINLAWQLKSDIVKPEYLLYALISQKGSLGAEILDKAKFNKKNIAGLIKEAKNNETATNYWPKLDQETIKIIEKSAVLAYRHNHPYVATEHLLMAIINSQSVRLESILQKNQINKKFIKSQLQVIFNSTAKFQNFASSFNDWLPEEEMNDSYAPAIDKKNLIGSFTTDLTDKAIQKKIDPVIGREEEITRLIEILMRRTKNNPLILGDPGVGKTALVEGLAKRILAGQVPEALLGKKILNLDIALIVAGTMFRGEFENRMKNILAEIKNNPEIIIFIDEIHNIIGAGSTQGSMDVANIIKPALARGEIRCIGATTYEEYKKHLEGDAALERRFQLIKINEPSIQETIKIIEGVKDNYEQYHQVAISPAAIEAAVKLSDKYITDRFFPDKAIDLIDEAAAKAKLHQVSNQHNLKLNQLEEQKNEITRLKEKAIIQENFKQAILLKAQEHDLAEQISQFIKIAAEKIQPTTIEKEDICQVIAKITHIPLKELLLQDRNKFIKLEQNLSKNIIGQDQALQTIAQAIRRTKAGVAAANKPLGSFIFIGPSGSGKTYTAKILSQALYERADALIKIDMSEFSEKFNISKLIGAPAGYVGYKETNKLTDAVKRNPNAIVLFDEIEKAHPDVFNLLLQILDDGYLTDAGGKKINFKNAILIMTSNLGTEKLNKLMGFAKDEQTDNDLTLNSELKKFFRPEFINRLDKIIIFKQLQQAELKKIIKLELVDLEQRLAKQGLKIAYDNKVINHLLQTNYNQEQGARFIKQNIENLIATPLAEKILTSQKTNFKIELNNKEISISS